MHEIQPDHILDFEPEEVRRLAWLPLAVRYKLDLCGLRMSLRQWTALPLDLRRELTCAAVTTAAARCSLHALFLQAGALIDEARSLQRGTFGDYVARKKDAYTRDKSARVLDARDGSIRAV